MTPAQRDNLLNAHSAAMARIAELEAERDRLGKLYSHLVKRVFDQYGLIIDSVWEKRVLSGEHDVPIPEAKP